MRAALFKALLLLAALCQSVWADQVTLKNGDRLSGKIVRADGKSLVIKTEFAGEVSVVWDAVAQMTADEPLYLTLADGSTVSGLLTLTGERVEVRGAAGEPVAADRAAVRFVRSESEQAEYVRRLDPGWREAWSGSANLGVALTSGNSDTASVALGLALTRATARDRTSLYASSLYARDSTDGDSRTTANAIRGGLRYDRDINRKWFGYGFTDLEHNGLQELKLRWVLGGGLGHHLVRNDRTQLDLLGGLDWNREYFEGDSNDRSSAEVQLGQTLAHRFNSRTSLKEQFFFFPNLTSGGYRANFDAALQTDITRRVGWQLTVSDRYLSEPPPGFKKNDLLLTTGLSFTLGGPAR